MEIIDLATDAQEYRIPSYFCENCGRMYENDVSECDFCDGKKFIKGNLGMKLREYVELSGEGKLKEYYHKVYGKKNRSEIRMNDKRVVLYLLMHKDGLIKVDNHKEMKVVIDKIFKWRRRNLIFGS